MMENPGKDSIIDIDANLRDTWLYSMFAPEIYESLRVAEIQRRPTYCYMERVQLEIKSHMRGILVDWLVELSGEYLFVPETLYLAVYYIDMYLSRRSIEKRRLQLLGITCMFMASKSEDIYTPSAETFCYNTANTYTKYEVLELEADVANTLEFQLAAPTAKTFLRKFLLAAHASYNYEGAGIKLECLANYLTELTLTHYDFMRFLPSVIAASSVFLARWTLTQSSLPWTATLECYTNYKASDLKHIVPLLQTLQFNSDSCHSDAIREKYSKDENFGVAALRSPKLYETLFLS